jgi:protein-S-isoprenylcysteine O-methyltransferase Ste14
MEWTLPSAHLHERCHRTASSLIMSFLKHIQAIILLPLMAKVVVPAIILLALPTLSNGSTLPFPLTRVLSVIGVLFIGLGLILMFKTIALFAIVGKGTLAPWAPPENLVVRGIYRHVRNPMISGVFSVLIGEALLFHSVALFAWFLLFVIINIVYIPLCEERSLERRFSRQYAAYKENVPRWIPRPKPWKATDREDL